ncbi:glycosyltransferase [Streptomyces spectabilis]|uniref:glycosyltransferase family 2 protein n=1 Tax=Streptomyces spectabilis TaxID=68270 RepID=UPI0033EAA98E
MQPSPLENPLSPRPRPEISVVIATRLRPERLGYLVDMHASLIRQSVPWEAVLVLDGADRDLLPAPLSADIRVRVLELSRPVGAAASRNLGLRTVRTPFVCYSDDDDLLSDDSLAVRHQRITEADLGWVAGWSADLHEDGSTSIWHCPTPPGVHRPGDVTGYWTSPEAQIPLGQTMLLARTDLVIAAGGHGGLPAGEDFCMVNGVTNLAGGELLPHVVYFYRQHPAQMTAGGNHYRDLRGPPRDFAFRHGRALRSALQRSHL